MVDDRMKEMRVTSRALAEKISTAQRSVTHSTIWAWTRNMDGYPPTSSYTDSVNRRLANALNIKPEVLAKAYEDSRRHLILTDPGAADHGKLSVLRKLFADSKQTKWTTEEIVNLIDNITGR